MYKYEQVIFIVKKIVRVLTFIIGNCIDMCIDGMVIFWIWKIFIMPRFEAAPLFDYTSCCFISLIFRNPWLRSGFINIELNNYDDEEEDED